MDCYASILHFPRNDQPPTARTASPHPPPLVDCKEAAKMTPFPPWVAISLTFFPLKNSNKTLL